MKNILVTGAAGNIGSGIVNKLIDNGEYFVVAVDNLSTGDVDKLPKNAANFRFIKSNVNEIDDISSIFGRYHFDYVFHFAAVVGVKRTINNPISVLNDINGIKNVLTLCKNTGVNRVFYSSSSEVYGEPVSLPQNEETTPLNSRLPYAIVKNVGEAFCKSYFQEYDLNYTVFRFFNTYGPNQSNDFVITKFIQQALRNEDISVYGDGSQTRTFCYIDDNVDTMLSCMKNDLFVNGTINIGSDIEYTIIELAKLIISITESSSQIVHLPPLAEGDMTRRMPDITNMKAILNRELIPLENGIKKILVEKY